MAKFDTLVMDRMVSMDLEIPPFPSVVVRLNQTLSREDYALRDLVDIVAQDQVLAALVIRYAQTAQFGSGRCGNNLNSAISRLGAEKLAKVAMALSLGAEVCKPTALVELKLEVWRRAMLSAELCRLLASHHRVNAGEAFLAGLLHDFGFTVAYACLEETLGEQGQVICLTQSQWRKVAAKYHTGLGTLLAQQWELPATLREVITNHHQKTSVASSPMLQLVALSDYLTDLVEADPKVNSDEIAKAPYLQSDTERRLVIESLAGLPALVHAASPEATLPKKAAPIERPDSTFVGNRYPVDLDVELTSGDRPQTMKARLINHAGLGLDSRAPLPTNSVARFTVKGVAEPLELWSAVSLCVKDRASHYIEVKPMALAGPTAKRWQNLLDGARTN